MSVMSSVRSETKAGDEITGVGKTSQGAKGAKTVVAQISQPTDQTRYEAQTQTIADL